MSDNIRRNTPLFPIGIVMQLTELSARQIRYYEEHELVAPVRTEGNTQNPRKWLMCSTMCLHSPLFKQQCRLRFPLVLGCMPLNYLFT